MCYFFMSFCIKKYKNILILIFLEGIKIRAYNKMKKEKKRLHELQCRLKERQAASKIKVH